MCNKVSKEKEEVECFINCNDENSITIGDSIYKMNCRPCHKDYYENKKLIEYTNIFLKLMQQDSIAIQQKEIIEHLNPDFSVEVKFEGLKAMEMF
ncbi:MAG: hypothetical protein NZ529_01705 [Cytophagaceae bacterium]|nr:hypothetical protein [Cytophagaceae bacterium]MDW8455482.1 hypothetical protein [Cytophagaceae bacterium]